MDLACPTQRPNCIKKGLKRDASFAKKDKSKDQQMKSQHAFYHQIMGRVGGARTEKNNNVHPGNSPQPPIFNLLGEANEKEKKKKKGETSKTNHKEAIRGKQRLVP